MILDDFTQGDIIDEEFVLTEGGVALDLTNGELHLSLRKTSSQTGNDLNYMNNVHSDAVNGNTKLLLTSDVTKNLEPDTYSYQIRYKSPERVFMIEEGTVKVKKSYLEFA